eukprot:Em0040g5a
MAEKVNIPLPDITCEDFESSWICFELVAAAKEWSQEKQALILPTLLRGKLVECYVELEADTKKAVNYVKEELVKRLRQLLLRGKPDTFENAIEAAREIELVLEFESKPMELNAKISSVEDCDTGLLAALKDLTERLGNMEAQIQNAQLLQVIPRRGRRQEEQNKRRGVVMCGQSVNMLLDSGAAVSVIRSGVLEDRSRNLVMATSRTAIGANGLPLNVMGQVDLDICLGNFRTVHTFIVVRDLTFECILGADFLKVNKAVMDFRNNTLHLGNSTIKIPSSDVSVSSDDAHSISVHALEDMDIPGRSVRLVIATLQKGSCGSTERISEGLIEPATVLPKHLCVARSLGRVLSVRGINLGSSDESLASPAESLKGDMNEEVRKMLSRGVIRPSSSPWSSPVVMVRKKNGSWRFCIDYRKLNAVTHQDAYPLPRIDATLESLAGSTLFTTLDLASGYWQVEIKEDDKEKTAFSTEKGHFEFNVMPFGLTNAPATFQRLMECILAGLTGEQCLIYIDDIIVFSASFPERLERLTNVFLKLQDAGLKLKTEKRFVKDYSKIAAPLFKLLSKENAKFFAWNSASQNAFEELKSRLVSPPILAYPDFKQPFLLHTDASDAAIGVVLSQVQGGSERVIAYWSRKLQKAERNYSTTEREALAVVASLKEFYPYVYGFPCKLITDHNPLTSLKGIKDVGGRLTRWLLFLQQFKLDFQYKPGRLHTNADTLSRIPSRDNTVAAIEELISEDTLHTFLKAQEEDPALGKVIEALKNGTAVPSSTVPGLKKTFLQDGLLCRKFRASCSDSVCTQLVVPKGHVKIILENLHNESGHLGVQRTTEKVKERFYWPGYEMDIQNWVQECQQCQKRNPPQPHPLAPLGSIKCTYPFDVISWDIMGPLPLSTKGHKYILVITDLFSKWVEAFPLAVTDSETLASVLMDEVVCRYGVPRSLHSDQGANLNSQVICALCKRLGINKTRTTAYHPQGNGQVERFNRTLEAILSKVVAENQRDWDCHIPKALFAYRTAFHESSGYSPFRVNFGRSPILPIDIAVGQLNVQEYGEGGEPTVPQYVETLNKSLRKIFSDVKEQLASAHDRSKKRYDKGVIGEKFTVGDQLVGSTKTLVVHRNRLKRCYGLPKEGTGQNRRAKRKNEESRPQENLASEDYTVHVPDAESGCCVDADDEPDADNVQMARPQRNRRPPDRYGIYVEH